MTEVTHRLEPPRADLGDSGLVGSHDGRNLRVAIVCARFNSEVTDARWNGLQWDVLTADGHSDTFDALVTATGFLHHPKAPEIAVAVLVEHGGAGPTVAAPIARQILVKYFNKKP